jgi:arylsulfatase A-like enzyme
VAPNFGFDQGFDYYINPKAGRQRLQMQSKHPSGRVLQGTDEDIVNSAFEFLDAFGRDRFFLYMHFMDLHQYVYDEAAPEWGNSYSDSYDKSLEWTDRLIGVIVSRLEEVGELDNTLLVLMSDHGEAFQEHGIEGHARNLHVEVTTVPVLMVLPFRLQEPIRVKERVSNIDIWPTILDMLGLPPLPNADGRSLMPLVLKAGGIGEGDPSLERVRIAHLDGRWGSPKATDPRVAVQDGDKRLLWRKNTPRRNRFYDLSRDPGEHEDLYSKDDPEVVRLQALAEDYLDHGESPWGVETPEVELDELRLNQLRALGYVIKQN